MKICGISDIHGTLPHINECDVLCICGDIAPLNIQRYTGECLRWFEEDFIPWTDTIPCEKIIFIAGNHDFFIQDIGYQGIMNNIEWNHRNDHLIYLQDNSYTYEGITFYGTPWVTGPYGWAFYSAFAEKEYEKIPSNVDVLLTHQPPKVGKICCSFPNQPRERDFGSDRLREAIAKRKIRYSLCGHIHSGIHEETLYPTSNVETKFFNVSLKDEDYKMSYEPLYFDVT